MSARYSTWIRIGGRLQRPKVEPLIKAIAKSRVSLEWGDCLFMPSATSELLEARRDGWLWLCDIEAPYGEFSELEAACRQLGLAYTRHSESGCDCDAELLDWRPGMKEPVVCTGSNDNAEKTFVPVDSVKAVLGALEAGHTERALDMLRELCPQVTALPPFEIV